MKIRFTVEGYKPFDLDTPSVSIALVALETLTRYVDHLALGRLTEKFILAENPLGGEEMVRLDIQAENGIVLRPHAVYLKSFDVSKKISTIKVIREETNMGLKDAKDLIESVNGVDRQTGGINHFGKTHAVLFLEQLSSSEAERVFHKLDNMGVEIEIRPSLPPK